ncbi:MAG: PspC domain-containing protein [Bacteroidales bacterium]|nr:PspC domain-containing protein [Bacteroidales bacterium]
MKEVEKVSLGGYAFTLDEDAAQLAGEYLGELERYYNGREGGREILEGIEERMAELIHEKCGREGVASRSIIEGIISLLGRPEDIEEAGESGPQGSHSGPQGGHSGLDPEPPRPKRKLYRDMSDKVVAGVCSGLGIYLNVDKVLFRLLFALLTLLPAVPFLHHGLRHTGFVLSAPVIYLILWICMPPARTARQRWEQRGEDGTVHGIQQSIESGAREVDEALRTVGQSGFWTEFSKIFEKFIGLILLILAFTGLFAGGTATVGSGFLSRHRSGLDNYGFLGLQHLYDKGMSELYEEAPMLASALGQPWIKFLLALVFFLPFLGILYASLQLLFGFKSPRWRPGLVIFILWLMATIAAALLLLTGALSTEWMSI